MASADNPSAPESSAAATTGIQPAAPPVQTAVKPADAAVKPLPPPRQPPSPERFAARLRFLDGLLVAVLLAFAFLGALFTAHNSDFLLHAASGRLIAHGDLRPMIGVDPFAFTTNGVYWANTNWLYDLIIYLVYGLAPFGGTVLVVLKALMIAALAEVMLRTARQPGRPLWVPVCCVALAVLTLSPRALLQPVSLSFFFLGLTYWLLHLPRQMRARVAEGNAQPPRRPFLPYWLIPPLCLLWVNLDGWFFLGPVTVALYLPGETLQAAVAPTGRGRPSLWAPGEQRTLLWVLVASIAACFISPHHYHAFTFPSSLGLSDSAAALARDEQFTALFCSPIESFYFHPQIGLTVAGMAFFPLVLLGLASFAAAQWVGRWSWQRVFVWAAFLVLACFRAGAIPFFAVVAGPIASLNFLDFAATRRSAASAVGGRREAWAIGGRILTLFAGILLLIATAPGWLQAQQPPPWQWRRVGWAVEPDPAMVRVANRINEWQKNAGLEHGVRWFNDSPAVLPFLAWYCPGARGEPGERACLDAVRLPLYDAQTARDYRQLRESLVPPKEPSIGMNAQEQRNVQEEKKAQEERLRKERSILLRSFDVHFVICYEPNPLRETSPLRTLLQAPDEWALLYVDGPAAVFGWRDPEQGPSAPQFSRYEVSAEREAFGSAAVPAPPPTELPTPAWWAFLWTPETPRPPEADEAGVQLVRCDGLEPVWRARNEKQWKAMWGDVKRSLASEAASGYFRASLSPYGPFQFSFLQAQAVSWQAKQADPPLPSLQPMEGEEVLLNQARRQFDYAPPAPLFLSIRAARRALAVKADDAQTYVFLAQAYFRLMGETREGIAAPMAGYPLLLRQIQIKTALRRALALDPKNVPALLLAQQMYEETGFRDLALQYAQEALPALAEKGVDITEPRKNVEAMQKKVEQLRDTWMLKTANKRTLEKVQEALKMNLPKQALDELTNVDWNAYDDKDPTKLFLQLEELNLLLQTGQVDDVAKELKEDEAKLKTGLGLDPTLGLPAYAWLRVQTAAAKGDYADADHWMGELEKAMQEQIAQTQRLHTARIVGNMVLRQASSVTAPVWLPDSVADDLREAALLAQADEMILEAEGRAADLETIRGWLALEAGNIPLAEEHIAAALKLPRSAEEQALDKALRLPSTDQINFRGRLLAGLCQEWLNAGK